MKPQDLFKIVVATVGLIVACMGAIDIITSVLFGAGLYELQHSFPSFYGIRGLLEVFLGILLMKFSPLVVHMVFPYKLSDEETIVDKK